ncbi:hypothetical protein [Parasitella parasitica]|uniref:Uncharacterized protein n=1 Tax=Parasitella parasitica TaxID=35722 RepID=A0A0B7N0P5_9FUNG|nr:hypothetical protein [Parasitella parasitica]
MAEDSERFKLPLKWKPGTDLMSKMLLSDPEIMRIVIQSLLGEDVPPDSYSVAPTEWADTKGVYTLHVSQNTSNEKFIPVLVVIQEEVNQSTMLEIVERSALVCENFRILPTVLVISIKSSSKLKNDGEFDVIDHTFLMQCESKFWASKCYLFFADNLVNMNTTNTFATALFRLCHFISNPNKSFTLLHPSNTQTISLTCEVKAHKRTQQ